MRWCTFGFYRLILSVVCMCLPPSLLSRNKYSYEMIKVLLNKHHNLSVLYMTLAIDSMDGCGLLNKAQCKHLTEDTRAKNKLLISQRVAY